MTPRCKKKTTLPSNIHLKQIESNSIRLSPRITKGASNSKRVSPRISNGISPPTSTKIDDLTLTPNEPMRSESLNTRGRLVVFCFVLILIVHFSYYLYINLCEV
ncbi:hypothetical protein Pint_36021 [Pistacia integerrima]|uniref:Uncharacterized protein n=1 Tax=Pistacia integerrima TaxID=434235 RepID=A0ACC0Y444_9ROSI|nr:hypothetical protein Pint_36021 [Pistacia integerrima]